MWHEAADHDWKPDSRQTHSNSQHEAHHDTALVEIDLRLGDSMLGVDHFVFEGFGHPAQSV